MPKMKTHKGTAKRYRKTGAGKWIRPKAWRGHHLEIKSSRRTRRYAGMANVSEVHTYKLEVLMPYAKKAK
jgi:large subunit ribosomal protein L35